MGEDNLLEYTLITNITKIFYNGILILIVERIC